MLHRPSSHVFRFVTALAACVLLAQLAPVSGNRRALKQDDEIILGDAAPVFPTEYYKGDGPGDGPYQYKEDSYSERESYERRGDGPGSYHREEHYEGSDSGPGGYQHREDHYEKVDVKTFTMQMTGLQPIGSGPNTTFTSTFRCAKPEDEPDFCLRPSYPGESYEAKRSSKFFKDLMEELSAAECTWFGEGPVAACPSFVPTGSCFPASMNCTFNHAAEECGCPFKGSAYFTAKGYVIASQVDSCESTFDLSGGAFTHGRLASVTYDRPYDRSYGSAEPIGTTHNVTAAIFRGHISSIVTKEGVKEAKGGVEFIPFLSNQTVDMRREFSRLGGLRALKHDVTASTAATNFEGLEYYPGERPDGPYHGHSGEGPMERYPGGEGPELYPGEGPEYENRREGPEYGPPKYGFGPEDSYNSYSRKVLVKGGSLKVTLVEAEYY